MVFSIAAANMTDVRAEAAKSKFSLVELAGSHSKTHYAKKVKKKNCFVLGGRQVASGQSG